LLVVGCWLLVVGCWLLVVGCWLLVVGCFIIHEILPFVKYPLDYILFFPFCQYIFKYFFRKFQNIIAHNVSADYDGLTARIKKCAAFLGLANCGCSEPWEWSAAE
jgi:hypothetical protein